MVRAASAFGSFVTALVCFGNLIGAAVAQNYPSQPIKIIVATPPAASPIWSAGPLRRS